MLGGVELPFEKGEDGHSDGDVLYHAITDAILGASGLGDIGSYFPPEDAKWKDANSADLLRAVWKDVCAAGWELVNLDCVIKLEKPKFLPRRGEVIESTYRHDYKTCRCGRVSVDGGHDYLRRCYVSKDAFTELSITEPVEKATQNEK